MIMAPPKPVIHNIEVYNCEDGFCAYYIHYDPAPAGVEVGVYLDGSQVETGDAEDGKIDTTSKQGVMVAVEVFFYTGAGATYEESVSNARMFTPSGDNMKLATPNISIKTLNASFVDIKWKAVSILSACNAGYGESMLYSIWFDGYKQADRDSLHIDFDDLTPGSSHTVKVQAVPRSGWNCQASDVASVSFTTPRLLTGSLHVVTVPPGALVQINGVYKGGSDMVYEHTLTAGLTRERVALGLHLNHFKDKSVNKTLRPGMSEYALYRLSPLDKIRGKTSKDSKNREVTFKFTFNGPGEKLRLLNQVTGQSESIPVDAAGTADITIPYDGSFFVPGKQKLVCIVEGTADRIRTFKTITIR